MWSFFQRVFRLAESGAHSAMDKLEDPIKTTEQGIQDLRRNLQTSLKELAEVKALHIRMRRDTEEQKALAATYEKKALLFLHSGQSGEIDKYEADRLASEALAKKEQATTSVVESTKRLQSQESIVAKLELNAKNLTSQISSWEGELATLKARASVAGATKKINKQLAQNDSTDTIAMLEKMKNRVLEEEALAESYEQIAMAETNIDAEIKRALASDGKIETEAVDSLAALKAKMDTTK